MPRRYQIIDTTNILQPLALPEIYTTVSKAEEEILQNFGTNPNYEILTTREVNRYGLITGKPLPVGRRYKHTYPPSRVSRQDKQQWRIMLLRRKKKGTYYMVTTTTPKGGLDSLGKYTAYIKDMAKRYPFIENLAFTLKRTPGLLYIGLDLKPEPVIVSDIATSCWRCLVYNKETMELKEKIVTFFSYDEYYPKRIDKAHLILLRASKKSPSQELFRKAGY